jgi:hypothetical protein
MREEILLHADALYAARYAMAETRSSRSHFGAAEIVRYLSDPQATLSSEQQRQLFAEPRLLADFRRLTQRLALAQIPAAAAAAAGSGSVDVRRFDVGTARVISSRVPGQTYVILRFNEGVNIPHALVLEGTNGELLKRALVPADQSGEIIVVLDHKNVFDETFLRLFTDPGTVGTFIF